MTRISHPTGSQSRSVEGNSNLARDGAPKKHTDFDFESMPHGVPVHPGMTEQQKKTAGVGGLGHSAIVEDGGNTMPHAYNTDILKSKDRGQVPVHPHMKSSTEYQHANDDGSHTVAHQGDEANRVLGASILSGSSKLPTKVREN